MTADDIDKILSIAKKHGVRRIDVGGLHAEFHGPADVREYHWEAPAAPSYPVNTTTPDAPSEAQVEEDLKKDVYWSSGGA